VINEDRLLALTMKNGRITLPHGLSYRVLVLPDHKVLSLAALTKIVDLVQKGAVVIGPKPETTASLVGGPASEVKRKTIADALWGDASQPSGERKLGLGRVAWGKTAREVLLADGVKPDAQLVSTGASANPGQVFDYLHKTGKGTGSLDYYFVSNQNKDAATLTATFRVSGKLPELWNPVTGETRPATAYQQADGQTTVPLELTPYGSVFVIFRKVIPATQQGTTAGNYPVTLPVQTLTGPWQVEFDPNWTAGSPATLTFDPLVSWTQRPEEGIKFYSGKATYRKTFDVDTVGRSALAFLDLGTVQDVGVARVRLNGKNLGIVWCPPFRVPVSGLLKPTGNRLEIEVVNSWRNRLVGDRGKPASERLTKTNITIRPDWQLLPSGLMGPVQILVATPP
ncbi:MAG: glycoside hydrolase, partial [Bacteroidetes bacterium]|nr:glycoside hydrolase [Fibrella sp.]